MPDVSYLVEIIAGVPVLATPAEIDITTADQLRLALLEATAYGHATVVVDMTRTRFCDSAGLSVLARAHKRALEEGRELRLVIPADGAVFRIFTLTRLDRFIPRFASLPEALPQTPAAALIGPPGPGPSPGLGNPARRSGSPGREVRAGKCGPVAESTMATGADAGRSLSGRTDRGSCSPLSARLIGPNDRG
ncbi:MAG: STAS domain-containing protein [Streptosporangiaceae bacterium]